MKFLKNLLQLRNNYFYWETPKYIYKISTVFFCIDLFLFDIAFNLAYWVKREPVTMDSFDNELFQALLSKIASYELEDAPEIDGFTLNTTTVTEKPKRGRPKKVAAPEKPKRGRPKKK